MVDFEWYRSFIAVYRSGTVTEAAKARFLTQPAISQHIAALESAMKQQLFQRTPRKMVATEQGKALYSRMAPSMDKLERISSNLQEDFSLNIPTIRLGTPLEYFYEVGLEKIPPNQLRLQITFGETTYLIEGLLQGKLDGVIATQQVKSDHIDYIKLDQEVFYLVAGREMSLPKSIQAIEPFLLEQPWIAYAPELPIIRRFWRIAFQNRPDINPIMIMPNLLLIRKAIEQHWGISVLPHYLCKKALHNKKLYILWQPQVPVSNDLWLAIRRVDRNKKEIEKLLSYYISN